MTCRRAHRLLAAYRRDDWSPRDRAALGQHLNTCPACRKIEFAYRSVGESVRQLPSITPPPGYRDGAIAGVRFCHAEVGTPGHVAKLNFRSGGLCPGIGERKRRLPWDGCPRA